LGEERLNIPLSTSWDEFAHVEKRGKKGKRKGTQAGGMYT